MSVSTESTFANPSELPKAAAQTETAGRLILAAVGWVLLAQIAVAPVAITAAILEVLGHKNILVDPISFTVMALLSGSVTLVAAYKRSYIVGHGDRRVGVGDGPIRRWWLLAILWFCAFATAFFEAGIFYRIAPQWVAGWRGASPWTLFAFAVLSITLAPLGEEFFFRGWLWTGLRRHWSAFPTALVSCGLWVVVHFGAGLLLPFFLLPLAVILGVARQFCGVRAAIILHATHNLIAFIPLLALLFTMPVTLEGPQGATECHKWKGERLTAEVGIEGCTAAIASGKYNSQDDLFALYLDRGLAYADKKDYAHAISDLDKAISLSPDSAFAYNDRGGVYQGKRDYDRAIADFNEAIRLDPNYANPHNNRGLIYFDQKQYDRAIVEYNEAIKLDHGSASAYNNRANAYRAKRDFDLALADYNEAIRLRPNYAIAYLNRGAVYGDKHDYDRAISDDSEAIKIDPSLADAYNNRGNAYQIKHDYEQAIADYSQAIGLNQNYAMVYNNRGNAYRNKKDYGRAIGDFNEAIALNPTYSRAYKNRGFTYFDEKDYERSIADLTVAIKLNPIDAEAYEKRGHAYRRKNDNDLAIADFTDAIRLKPDDADAYNARCWARALVGRDLLAALSDCNDSLRLWPNDANVIDSRALVYLKLGKLDEAMGDYEAVLKLDPKLAGSLYGRGVVKQKKGDANGAEADMTAARMLRSDIANEWETYGVK